MTREKTLARPNTTDLEQLEPWNTFRDMERMFHDFFTSPIATMRPTRFWITPLEAEFVPEVDLRETEKELILEANLPGYTKNDIEIDVTKDMITLTGERKQEDENPAERYHLRQRSYGSFRVSYSLPAEVKTGDVKAVYKNGILEVTMPKAEVVEAHKVKIEEKSK